MPHHPPTAHPAEAHAPAARPLEARPPEARPPVALSIAGSDPSGGAGIQADLKTFSALGAFGTCVITALTAQNTCGVTGVHEVPTSFVRLQLDTLLDDVRVDAVKIGMLASADLARTVADYLRPDGRLAGRHVVLDPVMVATSGARLLAADAVEAVRDLIPLADLITPNLPEAAVLLDVDPARTPAEMDAQARELLARGARRVLLKGGHLGDPGAESGLALDVYADADGLHQLSAPRVDTGNTHGTGCSLSSALAALRPRRSDWLSAASEAKAWLTGALARADDLEIGAGSGPVHHFYEFTSRWPAP